MENLFLTSILSMTGLAIFFAAILSFADKKLKVEEDPLVAEILEALPGVNCGACGCLSCADFAEHLSKGDVEPLLCRVNTDEARSRICKLLGKEDAESAAPMLPVIKCAATWDDMKIKADYKGIKTCASANMIFGGGLECTYGCLGYGDCTRTCQFDALHMVNGLPVLDAQKCTGCGQCAEVCPRSIIDIQEKKNDPMFYVACSSKDSLQRTRQVCSVGCIACGVCVKLSQEGFFKVEENLSSADYSKQDKSDEIKTIQSKCPTKVIKNM